MYKFLRKPGYYRHWCLEYWSNQELRRDEQLDCIYSRDSMSTLSQISCHCCLELSSLSGILSISRRCIQLHISNYLIDFGNEGELSMACKKPDKTHPQNNIVRPRNIHFCIGNNISRSANIRKVWDRKNYGSWGLHRGHPDSFGNTQ